MHFLKPGEGELALDHDTGMWRGHDPLFSGQLALKSLPIYRPKYVHFKFLDELYIFNLVFEKNFNSQNAIFFKIFIIKTPHFSHKICFLDPTFGNLRETHIHTHTHTPHTHTQLSAPLGYQGSDSQKFAFIILLSPNF